MRIVRTTTKSVRKCRPGKSVQMTEQEVRALCLKSREIFLQQPILLELEAPLSICGEFPAAVFHPFSARIVSMVESISLSQAISTASSPICCGCSSTVAIRQRITYSSATTWTGENSRSKRFAYCSHTKSNIRRISSFCAATMNVPVLTEFTVRDFGGL